MRLLFTLLPAAALVAAIGCAPQSATNSPTPKSEATATLDANQQLVSLKLPGMH